jgi:hypothetical protein
MEIRRDRAHARIEAWSAGYDTMYLIPGGWLIAVTVQIDRGRRDFAWPEGMPRNEPLHFEVTDGSLGAALYGSFDVNHHIGYDQGGIVFDEPLPNVDTTMPYVIHATNGPLPAVRVYSLNCWHIQ